MSSWRLEESFLPNFFCEEQKPANSALIHMVGGWMGRVSMCNEPLLDECYLCLLAQVSFILEFSPTLPP